jgi:hypothetical protein
VLLERFGRFWGGGRIRLDGTWWRWDRIYDRFSATMGTVDYQSDVELDLFILTRAKETNAATVTRCHLGLM